MAFYIVYTIDFSLLVPLFLDNGVISRKSGNVELLIKNGNVIRTIKAISLYPITKPVSKHIPFMANPNIGVVDIETFMDVGGISKVYAAGLLTNLDPITPYIYYINLDLNSDDLILKLINEMLRTKYNKTTFYCDNLGGYDIIYLKGFN